MTAIGEPTRAECDKGFTVGGVGGGATFYYINCEASGEFTGTENKCEAVGYSVSGEVTDVTDGAIKIAGAKVVFEMDGIVWDTAYTNSMGMYTVSIGVGKYDAKASKTGYVTSIRQVTVEGPIQMGQGADMSMTEVLPAGTWRAVVDWGEESEDIDSHSYFGDQETTHVYWADRGPMTAPSTDVTVVLDRDDVTGYGPETTTFEGVGECVERGKCLIKFKIKNYSSWSPVSLGDSQVKIKLYAGANEAQDFAIPTSVGSDIWYTVFTIDARKGIAYAGEWHDAPYAEGVIITNWYQSLDWNTWSHTPPDAF
jgi:hypothetical protein